MGPLFGPQMAALCALCGGVCGAGYTNRSAGVPTVYTNRPFVRPAGKVADQKVAPAPLSRRRVHKSVRGRPHRVHKSPFCAPGREGCGRKSGLGKRPARRSAPGRAFANKNTTAPRSTQGHLFAQTRLSYVSLFVRDITLLTLVGTVQVSASSDLWYSNGVPNVSSRNRL